MWSKVGSIAWKLGVVVVLGVVSNKYADEVIAETWALTPWGKKVVAEVVEYKEEDINE